MYSRGDSFQACFDRSWVTGIIHRGLLVALPARPDAEEQTADIRFRRYPVPALPDVIVLPAVVLLSAWTPGSGRGSALDSAGVGIGSRRARLNRRAQG